MKKIALIFGMMLLCGGVTSVRALPDASVAGLRAPKADETFFTPPFVSNFDTKADFDDHWRTVDRDGDAFSWSYETHDQWPALDGSDEGGCLRSGYNASRAADDWLITAKPVKLAPGKAYIAFVYASGHRDPKELERLAVYCGTDAEPDELLKHEVAAPWTFYGREWKFKVIEVDIAAEGEYYFGLRACSDANRLNIYVDEIEIGQGDYKGVPNLSLDYLYLPISSCNLGQSEIGLRLINRGKTDIESFELTYQVGEEAPVTGQFTTPIGALDTIKVAFAQKADLSADGMYTVRAEGKVLTSASGMEEAAGMQRDNVITGQVTHFTETTLPFVTDMNKAEDRAQWGFAAGTWSYDPNKVLAIRAEDTLPLISRCVPLQADHSYRFTFDYVGGIDVLGILGTEEDFDVLYGPAGTPVAGWNLIKRYENVQTENLLVRDEVVFTPTADGVYAFAIVSRREFGVLYIQTVSVTEIKEHDVVLQDWVTRLGRMTPARHAVKPSFEALIANRGMNDEAEVKMVLRSGDKVIGQSASASIRKDSLAVFRPINGEIPQPALNEEVTLRLSVEMPIEDGNPYDNAADFTFLATDTLYVFDACDADPESGVGSPLAIGNIFTLAEQDTLTAITVSWVDISAQYPSDFDVAVEIYPVDMTTGRVSNATMSRKVKRGLKGGFRTIELPAHIMPAGSYLIGLRQLGSENISVAVDGGSGYFFMTANGAYAIQGGKGFLGIRAVFGTVQSLQSRDIELLSIDSPKEVGAFTANQPIRVSYRNNGFETMEVEFKCTVNDKVLTSKRTVRGYESGRVSFTTDMSAVGKYTITVEATAVGDENPDNNAIRKAVECVFIDPRIMNFEYCDDFAVSGFVPAWKSVDVDGILPGPHDLTFPNLDAPFGFMAYNSYEAGEIDENTGEIVNVAHSGARCGMSLVTQPQSDDWLISPEFSMDAKADSLGVSLWVRSSDPNYKEWYNVLVSTTNDKPTSFEVVPTEDGAMMREAPGEWTKVWVDLSAYAGKNIYVAIQCISQDAWMFLVDDIAVNTGNLSNESSVDLSRYVKSYPNPVRDEWTVTAYDLQIRRVEICNMTGGIVFRSADNLSTEVYRVNMEDFTPGLYTARVYTNAGVQTLKVIVR